MTRAETDEVSMSPGRVRMLGMVWLVVLAIGLGMSAHQARWQTEHVEEFPVSCDSFGYLQMAEDMRVGHAAHDLPKFTAGSAKGDPLIAEMERLKIPLSEWDAFIGPQAYDYKPQVRRLVNQYPPGVPMLLALFPRGKALATLYTITWSLLMVLSLGGLAVMGRQWWRGQNGLLLGAAGIWAVAFNLAFMMLGTTVSYSADFFTVPGIATLLLIYATERHAGWRGGILLAAAGACAGLAILIRLPAALLVPGFLVLVGMAGATLWARVVRCAWFAVPLFLAGILPLLLHNQALVGSALVTTYGTRDTQPPTFDAIGKNLAYYFSGGDGSLGNWALWLALVGAGAAVMYDWTIPWTTSNMVRQGRRWLAGMAVLFLVPAIYFLTHVISTSYYQLPAVLTATLAAALAVLAATREPIAKGRLAELGKVGIVLMLLPGLAHLFVAFTPSNLTAVKADAEQSLDHDIGLIPEFKDPNTWILADRYTGTLWYFHGIHAQNVLNATPRVRLAFYRFALQRHEKVFVIVDIPSKPTPYDLIGTEIVQYGGKVREAGQFDRQRIYEISWPEGGPKEPATPR